MPNSSIKLSQIFEKFLLCLYNAINSIKLRLTLTDCGISILRKYKHPCLIEIKAYRVVLYSGKCSFILSNIELLLRGLLLEPRCMKMDSICKVFCAINFIVVR